MDISQRFVLTATALLAVLMSSLAAAVAQSATPASTGGPPVVDAWVRDRMAAHGLPGTAVAVVREGGIVHLAGYGVADPRGRPVTPRTPFILGSASKPFTAVVVGQLVEEGLLSWDDRVWPYLAHLVDVPPEGFEAATVEQLLTHTAGLGMSVGTAGTVTIHDGPQALDRRVVELLSHPLGGAPGADFEYSNAGFMLLASVAEQVTGQSFAELLRDRVFEPLGMTHSFATAEDVRAADLATGHQQWFGRWRPVDLPYDDAGAAMGYIVSSADDLARFLQAHLRGHPAIPATAQEIAGSPVTDTGWTTPLDGGYGRGWFVDTSDGAQTVSHPGSLGHFTAHLLLAPDADLGIAVLSNASAFVVGHEAQYDIGLGLLDLLLGAEPVGADPSPLVTVVAPVLLWLVVGLQVAMVIRYLARLRLSGPPGVRHRDARGWLRALLPAVAMITVGGGLLGAAPLGLARHFYPDGGWAVTVGAWTALVSGLGLLGVVLVTRLRPGRVQRRH